MGVYMCTLYVRLFTWQWPTEVGVACSRFGRFTDNFTCRQVCKEYKASVIKHRYMLYMYMHPWNYKTRAVSMCQVHENNPSLQLDCYNNSNFDSQVTEAGQSFI